jgi:periplasmic divalent cation tolerance protein
VSSEPRTFVVLCPVPDLETGRGLARRMVEGGHAACVQLLGGGCTSWYRWEGRLCEETEHLLVLKTSRSAWPRLRDALQAAHPYDVPEILALPAEGATAYVDWVDAACGGSGGGP